MTSVSVCTQGWGQHSTHLRFLLLEAGFFGGGSSSEDSALRGACLPNYALQFRGDGDCVGYAVEANSL